MSQPVTLEELMVRYQKADSAAATALIEELSPPLHRFFLMQVASRRFADDLLQETWLRLHQARHTYRPGEPVLPWVYAIARHVRIDGYRKLRRIEMREETVDELPESAPHRGAEPRNDLPELEEMLRCLPDSQREVVTMLKVTGLTLDEVAKATSSSVGSVKQKAHRAYDKLREVLTSLGFGARQTGGSL